MQHEALVYDSDEQLAGRLLPIVHEGFDGGDPVLAILDPGQMAAVGAALGKQAQELSFLPAADWYQHPRETAAALCDLFVRCLDAGAARVHVIGEIPLDTRLSEQRRWLRYEAAVNEVFAALPVRAVCLYDQRAVPAWVVASAAQTHPWCVTEEGSVASTEYWPPRSFAAELAARERAGASVATSLEIDTDLRVARDTVRWAAAQHGMDAEHTEQLLVAVNEAVTNAVTHGAAPVRLTVMADESTLMCEVTDEGPGFHDPLAGYRLPRDEEEEGGRGLWLARKLCDSLELEVRQDAFAVVLSMRLP